MATLTQLATSNLALKGAGDEYNYINRFFATKAEADAALADGSWTPEAGKLNACLTGDQGLLVYNEGTSSLDLADEATRAYVDAQIGSLVDGAPGTLDTLNELAAAINDNPNYFTDAESARQANTNLINAETSRATAAETAIQADVDQNEADADAADAALDARLVVLEADPTTATAVAAVQADVDQNEADADAAIAALQADVDQNEADADAAIAAEEARALAAEAAIQADVDQNEQDADNAIAAETARALAAEQVIQNDVDANETAINASLAAETAARIADVDAEEARALAAEALLAPLDSPVLTGTPQAPTANAGTSTTQLATTAFVSTAVANLVDNAPGTLDTLNEIATALGNDANLSTTLTNSIAAVQADVDQNELDSDTADAALGVRIDNVEAEIDTARTNIYAALGRTEGVQQMGTFSGSLLGDNQTVKDLFQTLETKAEALESLKANLSGSTFTGDIIVDEGAGPTIKLETSQDGNAGLVFAGGTGTYSYIDTANGFGNDSLQLYSGLVWVRAINGGDGTFMADGAVTFNSTLSVTGALTLGGTEITATGDELNYVDGVTSNIQTQLDAIQADVDQNESDADAAIAAVQADVDQNESDSDAADAAIVDGTTNFTGFQLQGTAVTATGAELNYVDVTSPGTADASKALVVDGTKSISGINTLTVQNLNVQGTTTTVDTVTMQAANAIQFEGLTADTNETILSIVDPTADHTIYLPNQSGYLPVLAVASTTQITATPEELNYVDGVTSNIQTQLDAIQADVDQNEADADAAIALKANIADPTFTGTVTIPTLDVNTAITTPDLTVDAGGDDAIIKFTLETDGGSDKGGLVWNRNSGGVDIGAITYHRSLDSIRFYTNGTTNFDVEIGSGGELNAQNGLAIGGTSITSTAAELNFVDGVTSSIQDQLDAIQADVNQNESDADAAISANEVHVDNLVSLSGVAKDQVHLSTFTGSTIVDNRTVKQALQDLETAVETKFDSSSVSTFGGTLIDDADAAAARTTLGLGSAATTDSGDYATAAQGATADAALPAAGAQAALSVDHLITLSGVAEASDDLGTFTGATINDNVTVKAALQALETAQEATQADVDQNESDADAAIAAVLAGTSIPGPYNNDSDAATGGVAVGAIYKNSNGTIHWRVS